MEQRLHAIEKYGDGLSSSLPSHIHSSELNHPSQHVIHNSDNRCHSVNDGRKVTPRSDKTRIGSVLSNPKSNGIGNRKDVTAEVFNLLSLRPPPPSYIVSINNSIGNNVPNFNRLPSPSVNKQQNVNQPVSDPERKRKVHHLFPDDGKRRKFLTQSKKLLSSSVNEISPELCTNYNLLHRVEQKLDKYLLRKSIEFKCILKKPPIKTNKLRIFVTTKVTPGIQASFCPVYQEATPPLWEMVIEGVLIDQFGEVDHTKSRNFSTFLQSLTIVLDENLYGPQDHIFEWTRKRGVKETKGFCIKRNGNRNVKYSISLQLKLKHDSMSQKYKWNKNLTDALGLNAQDQYSKDTICRYLWQYIKSNSLQDATENEYINLDEKLNQIFRVDRMLFTDIPLKLPYLMICPPPVIITDIIRVEQGEGNLRCQLDLDIDLEDTALLSSMKEFLEKTKAMQNSETMKNLNNKLDTVLNGIHKSRLVHDFHLQFQKDPQKFIHKWLQTNTENLKIMMEMKGNPEEERRSEFYNQTWTDEAIARYLYSQEISRK